MAAGSRARQLWQVTTLLGLCGASGVEAQSNVSALDKPIADISADLQFGRSNSERLVRSYLSRIDAVNRKGPALRAVLTVNSDARAEARVLDQERRAQRIRGPLHGIPILVKDNIETRDRMATTAGSLALAENFVERDAPIVANLRAAGVVVLGKTNLSEWANFRSSRSISGWSALGGLTKNPHVLDRSACGSSSGSAAAVAAAMAVAALGTETDGSITCPASMNGVVGLKPTHGLLDQTGIVPVAHSQDTAGPMTRTVADAALLLSAMTGTEAQCRARVETCRHSDYIGALSTASLAGKRIGVWRFRTGIHPPVDVLLNRALDLLREAGAEVIEVPTPDTTRARLAEEIVLFAEFKEDVNAYLRTLPPKIQTRSLGDLIAFNLKHPRELVLFGQELFIRANESKQDEAYRSALADGRRAAGPDGIGRTLREHRLDFIVAPTNGPAWRIDIVSGDQFSGSFSALPAISGYPHLTVPMGAVQDLPVGLSFIGAPWSEAMLLAAGHVYEQRSAARPRAKFKPTLEAEGHRDLQ